MRRFSILCAAAAALTMASHVSALPCATSSFTKYYNGTSLKKLGRAISYPIKKAAGNGSKTANKTGQAVQYPVRKAGENTSKAAHKSGLK